MNPGLLWISAILLAGALALRRRRDVAAIWLVVGLSAAALLGGSLGLPDGIPSPTGSLVAVPPWQEAGAPRATHAHLRDVTFFVEPWLVWARAEWRAGRWPFWNPHQLAGGPFWSNGQAAPLFPLHLLFDLLPLQIGFVLLPWARLALGGLGSFLLARELGLAARAGVVAALAFPLGGMLTAFLLFPIANALALVPWVLLAVERLASGRSGWRLLAGLAGAQLLAGHPETVVCTAVIGGVYLLGRGAPGRTWGQFAAGWGVAGLVAAAALLPFLLALAGSHKWSASGPTGALPFAPLIDLQARLLLPEPFGHPARATWWGPFNYEASAIYAGALALPLAIAGCALARREKRWRGVAALTLFSWLAAYPWPGVQPLLAAVPLLRKVLFHYFLAGVALGLALLAAAGFAELLAGRRRGLAIGGAIYLALLGLAWWRFAGAWTERGLVASELAGTAIGVAGLALLGLVAIRPRSWPAIPLLLACDLLLAHAVSVPRLEMERFFPRGPAIDFLSRQEGRVAALGHALRPNAATVYGLDDVRGEDALGLAGHQRLARELAGEATLFFAPIRRWDSPWLDRLAVRWVLAAPGQPPPDASWRLALRAPEATLYERPNAWPRVRWQDPSAPAPAPRVELRRPGFWRIGWRSERPALLVVAETWDAGWRARLDGRPVPVEVADEGLLGVRLEAGAGRLELRYRPRGFALGTAASLGGVLLLAGEALRRRIAKWRRTGAAIRAAPRSS